MIELNDLIKQELKKAFASKKQNPSIIISNNDIYKDIAKRFNVHPERVRKHHRMLKLKDLSGISIPNETYSYEVTKKVNNEIGTFESTAESNFEPKNDQELSELHKIDLSKYKISSYWSKMKPNGKFSSSVLASLRNTDTDLKLQKEIIIKELINYSPKIEKLDYNRTKNKNKLIEIVIFDAHFGKMAHEEESGEDYDLKIAGERYKNAVYDLVSNVNMNHVEKILFPIGNDLFNVDNINKTTTNFTPQDTDTRFHKMVKYVKNLLIDVIDYLSSFAPVDIVVIQGNHDQTVSFLCGEILDAFYYKNPNIKVDNNPKLRKYYKYGLNSFMFTHGDKEKQNELGMIFAAENSLLWSDTKYRFIQIGHFHHTKKINYLMTNEFQGFQIQVMPSISSNDAWHTGKGYSSLRQAKAFLYDKESGLNAEFTHNVK